MNKRSAEWICWVQKELVKAEMMGQKVSRQEVEDLADERFLARRFEAQLSVQEVAAPLSSVGVVSLVSDDPTFIARGVEGELPVELWAGCWSKYYRILLKIPVGWGLLKNGVVLRKDLYWKPTFVGHEDEMSYGELYSKDLEASGDCSAWRPTTLIGEAYRGSFFSEQEVVECYRSEFKICWPMIRPLNWNK